MLIARLPLELLELAHIALHRAQLGQQHLAMNLALLLSLRQSHQATIAATALLGGLATSAPWM
jgi:hypothetical protein